MCRLCEIKHLAVGQTKLSLRAFTPAESLMRVHSVRTLLHNLRLWEIEGHVQIYASLLYCINSLRAGFYSRGGGCVTLSCTVHSQSRDVPHTHSHTHIRSQWFVLLVT